MQLVAEITMDAKTLPNKCNTATKGLKCMIKCKSPEILKVPNLILGFIPDGLSAVEWPIIRWGIVPRAGQSFVGELCHSVGQSFIGELCHRAGQSFVGELCHRAGQSFIGELSHSVGQSFVGELCHRGGQSFVGELCHHAWIYVIK